MRALRPDRGRRYPILRHRGSWDLAIVWRAPIIARFAPALLRNCDCEVGPVRGTDEAVRHFGQFVLGYLLAAAKGARAFAGYVMEDAAKGAEAVPAGLESDVHDWQVGIPEQSLGALDPTSQQIAVRRQPEGLLERTGEMRLRNAAYSGEARDRPLLVRGRVHAVLGAQQTAQQQITRR